MICKYVCAFLNSQGGTIYIGIADNGIVKGVSISLNQINQF